jgi:AICAR transformylase/IMP cyclohydrolase PurH
MTGKVALLSAYRKNNQLCGLAEALVSWEWKLLASEGTKKFLDKHGIPSTDIAEIVGPPILGRRVKTLHPKIHAALLADTTPEDMADLEHIEMRRIDLVYVGLCPLADELKIQASKSVSWMKAYTSVLGKIDIGGSALLCAAARGGRVVISSHKQIRPVLDFLNPANAGDQTRDDKVGHPFLAELAAQAANAAAEHATFAAEFYRSIACGEFPQRFRK